MANENSVLLEGLEEPSKINNVKLVAFIFIIGIVISSFSLSIDNYTTLNPEDGSVNLTGRPYCNRETSCKRGN